MNAFNRFQRKLSWLGFAVIRLTSLFALATVLYLPAESNFRNSSALSVTLPAVVAAPVISAGNQVCVPQYEMKSEECFPIPANAADPAISAGNQVCVPQYEMKSEQCFPIPANPADPVISAGNQVCVPQYEMKSEECFLIPAKSG